MHEERASKDFVINTLKSMSSTAKIALSSRRRKRFSEALDSGEGFDPITRLYIRSTTRKPIVGFILILIVTTIGFFFLDRAISTLISNENRDRIYSGISLGVLLGLPHLLAVSSESYNQRLRKAKELALASP